MAGHPDLTNTHDLRVAVPGRGFEVEEGRVRGGEFGYLPKRAVGIDDVGSTTPCLGRFTAQGEGNHDY